jgi:transposase
MSLSSADQEHPEHKRSQNRRAWFQEWQANGHNAAAVCRKFGISRTTFYRWLPRYQAGGPLRERSRRPHRTRAQQWPEAMILALIELTMSHSEWGRDRLHSALSNEYACSPATVGRMLAAIRYRCPVCRERNGHDVIDHLWRRDLTALHLAPPVRLKSTRGQSLSKPGAVAAAERLLRRRGAQQ